MLESRLEAKFRKAVRRIGGRTIKMVPVEAGMPDRLVLMPGGRAYLVELKADDGVVSPIQRAWHQQAADLGHTVTVLRGAAEVDLWVKGL